MFSLSLLTENFITKNFFSYHLGTAALGAILTIGLGVKIVAEMIKQILEVKETYFGTPWYKCCNFGCKWLDNALKYINNNALVMCAIHGTSFFESARQAFDLKMRNYHLIFMGDWVSIVLT